MSERALTDADVQAVALQVVGALLDASRDVPQVQRRAGEPDGPRGRPRRPTPTAGARAASQKEAAPELAPSVPALALTCKQAASALSLSFHVFHEQVEPDLKLVRVGRRKLIPVAELQHWLERHADHTLEPEQRARR